MEDEFAATRGIPLIFSSRTAGNKGKCWAYFNLAWGNEISQYSSKTADPKLRCLNEW